MKSIYNSSDEYISDYDLPDSLKMILIQKYNIE